MYLSLSNYGAKIHQTWLELDLLTHLQHIDYFRDGIDCFCDETRRMILGTKILFYQILSTYHS